ncbi:hypothetical protein GmHk_17G049829 [Glycine max]|nr:hypothetical protein GmHk_17G049829 [Glycine max]
MTHLPHEPFVSLTLTLAVLKPPFAHSETTILSITVSSLSVSLSLTISLLLTSYGEVSRSFVIRWKDEQDPTWNLLHSSSNMYSVIYNQDLVTLTHFGKSVFLLTIFKSSSEPKDVLSTMYSFMRAKRFTHLNLEWTTECRIVYNHYRKTAKI